MAGVSLSLPSSLSQQTLGDKESANNPHIGLVVSFDTRCKDTQFPQNKAQESIIFAVSSINF